LHLRLGCHECRTTRCSTDSRAVPALRIVCPRRIGNDRQGRGGTPAMVLRRLPSRLARRRPRRTAIAGHRVTRSLRWNRSLWNLAHQQPAGGSVARTVLPSPGSRDSLPYVMSGSRFSGCAPAVIANGLILARLVISNRRSHEPANPRMTSGRPRRIQDFSAAII